MRKSVVTLKNTIIIICAMVIAISISKIPPYGVLLMQAGGHLKVVMPWEYLTNIKAFKFRGGPAYFTFFAIPITSGISFIALHMYLALSVYFLALTIKGKSKKSYIFYSTLLLLATIGTYNFYWLE